MVIPIQYGLIRDSNQRNVRRFRLFPATRPNGGYASIRELVIAVIRTCTEFNCLFFSYHVLKFVFIEDFKKLDLVIFHILALMNFKNYLLPGFGPPIRFLSFHFSFNSWI